MRRLRWTICALALFAWAGSVKPVPAAQRYCPSFWAATCFQCAHNCATQSCEAECNWVGTYEEFPILCLCY
jgi:hypothetical protein